MNSNVPALPSTSSFAAVVGRPRQTLLVRSHCEVFQRVVTEGIKQRLSHHYLGEDYDLRLEVDAYPTDEEGRLLCFGAT